MAEGIEGGRWDDKAARMGLETKGNGPGAKIQQGRSLLKARFRWNRRLSFQYFLNSLHFSLSPAPRALCLALLSYNGSTR
jgi:hypothetical protein